MRANRPGGVREQQGCSADQGQRLSRHQGARHGLAPTHHRGVPAQSWPAGCGGDVQSSNSLRPRRFAPSSWFFLRARQRSRFSPTGSSPCATPRVAASSPEPILPGASPLGPTTIAGTSTDRAVALLLPPSTPVSSGLQCSSLLCASSPPPGPPSGPPSGPLLSCAGSSAEPLHAEHSPAPPAALPLPPTTVPPEVAASQPPPSARGFIIRVPHPISSLAARLKIADDLATARADLLAARRANVELTKRMSGLEVAARRKQDDSAAALRVPDLLQRIAELERQNRLLLADKRYATSLELGKGDIAKAKVEVASARKEKVKLDAELTSTKATSEYLRERNDKLRETLKNEAAAREALEAEAKRQNQQQASQSRAAATAKAALEMRATVLEGKEGELALRVARHEERERAAEQCAREREVAASRREEEAARQEGVLKGRVQAALQREAAALEKERGAEEIKAKLSSQLETVEDRVAEAVAARDVEAARADAAEKQIREANLQRRGRKSGHAGRAELELKWPEMGKEARRKAMLRHTRDIADYLEVAAANWEPTAFATALEWLDLLPDLFATRHFAEARMEFAQELAELLQAEWNMSLALYLKTEIGISDTDYLRLRLSMCKEYKEGKWVSRIWYQDALTGRQLCLPQPLVARWRWLSAWRGYGRKYGLECKEDGSVAQRGFLELLTEMIARDAALLAVDMRSSLQLTWHPAFHIDATSISARRGFTHAGITLGGLYKNKTHVQSELKLMTLAVGTVKDNASGQRQMLGDGVTSGIAAEIAELNDEGVIGVDIQDDKAAESEESIVLVSHCKPVACLDLAAARAMRACRGKAACMCGCQSMSALQSYPGNDEIPAIPHGNSLDVWRTAEVILHGACSYGTEKMTYISLEAAAHVPPRQWNFQCDGAWRCSHCKKDVWSSKEEYLAAKAKVAKLAARAADEDEDAQKELTKLMKEHASTHMDATYLEAPIVRFDTDALIVDPMHCLELNLAKTAWKHSFGNRMLPHHRERVAEYLNSIGCPLDIREKGKRDNNQKWFTASAFDDYVNGVSCRAKSASPGLAENTWAICERVFDALLPVAERYSTSQAAAAAAPPRTASTAARSTAASSSQPPPPPTATAPRPQAARRKRMAPSAGFSNADRIDHEDAPENTAELDLSGLHSTEAPLLCTDSAVRTFVRGRFGNHASEVLDVLRLWEAYHTVHAAWREEWTADNESYRAARALRLLRAGVSHHSRSFSCVS
eukprot:6173385-Pleurochrysis_carterae.AAC.2